MVTKVSANKHSSSSSYWSSEDGQAYIDTWFSLEKIKRYCLTRSPKGAVDIDDWHAREHLAPLFVNDNDTLHRLIHDRLILPYLTGSFRPDFIAEYVGSLLLALQKSQAAGEGLRSILCGETWRRCFASLAADAVRNDAAEIFTSTYEIFIQTAGIRDGASHCAKLLSNTCLTCTLCAMMRLKFSLRRMKISSRPPG